MITKIRTRPGKGAFIGPNGERGFKTKYLIQSNTPYELRAAILMYPYLPQYGYPHPEDATCTCSNIELDQLQEDPTKWEMDARWTTNHSTHRNEQEDQKQPDQRRPKWSARFQPIDSFLPRDRQGKAFCDSAGSPFDPPPNVPIWVRAVTIFRYEPTWSEVRDLTLINATNTDQWRMSKPGEALISDVVAEEQWVMGGYWFAYTYTILQNPFITLPGDGGTIGGWDPLLIVDAGPKVLDATTGKPTIVPDPNGIVDGRPIYLDGSGHRLAPNGDGSYTPVMLSFNVKQKTAFGPLNLVPPFGST